MTLGDKKLTVHPPHGLTNIVGVSEEIDEQLSLLYGIQNKENIKSIYVVNDIAKKIDANSNLNQVLQSPKKIIIIDMSGILQEVIEKTAFEEYKQSEAQAYKDSTTSNADLETANYTGFYKTDNYFQLSPVQETIPYLLESGEGASEGVMANGKYFYKGHVLNIQAFSFPNSNESLKWIHETARGYFKQ